MRFAIAPLLTLLLAAGAAAPAAAQDWRGTVRHGRVVIQPDDWYPGYPAPPYPLPYVQYYPGAETADYERRPPPPETPDQMSRRYPSWFYCDAAYAYFPYVKTCAAGFRPVPMGPPPQDAPPPEALTSSGLAWCERPQGLYPYVKTCIGGWTAETGARPQGAPNGPSARWFYCDAAKGFSPYVETCAAGWREIAAAPPPVTPPVQALAQAQTPPVLTPADGVARGRALALPPSLTPDELPEPR